MAWPIIKLPFTISLSNQRKTITLVSKVPFDLVECTPKGVPREGRLLGADSIDFYHLQPDGRIEHTPIK